MPIHLTRKRGFRFAGVAAAAGALAVVGLVPAASAQTVARAGPGAAGLVPAPAVAAPRSSICHWEATPSRIWVTDPTNSPVGIIGGNYNRGRGVAYKVTGRFAHSTTMSFTAYNNLVDIESPASVLNDVNIIPD